LRGSSSRVAGFGIAAVNVEPEVEAGAVDAVGAVGTVAFRLLNSSKSALIKSSSIGFFFFFFLIVNGTEMLSVPVAGIPELARMEAGT
jgi:hypothetical protein